MSTAAASKHAEQAAELGGGFKARKEKEVKELVGVMGIRRAVESKWKYSLQHQPLPSHCYYCTIAKDPTQLHNDSNAKVGVGARD